MHQEQRRNTELSRTEAAAVLGSTAEAAGIQGKENWGCPVEIRGLQPACKQGLDGAPSGERRVKICAHPLLGPWHGRCFTSNRTNHTLHLRSCTKCPSPGTWCHISAQTVSRCSAIHKISGFRKLREWSCKSTRQRSVKKKKEGKIFHLKWGCKTKFQKAWRILMLWKWSSQKSTIAT